jgi:hypothetical protein
MGLNPFALSGRPSFISLSRICSSGFLAIFAVSLGAPVQAGPDEFEQVVKTTSVDRSGLSVVEKLERGEMFTARMATSFVMQTLIRQDPSRIQEAMSKDLVKFARTIPDLAFARAFRTSNDKKLLYLKLRSLGGGTGAMVEVIEGFNEAFKSAPMIPVSGVAKMLRPSGANISNPWEARLEADVERLSKESLFNRTVGVGETIRMIGPLHESFALEGVSVDIQISFKPYTLEKKPDSGNKIQIGKALEDEKSGEDAEGKLRLEKEKKEDETKKFTLFTTQVAFVPVVPKQSLGDFAGFGERKLVTAEYATQKFLGRLRDNLERIQ